MFGPTNNNPRDLPEQHFVAHVGLYPSFSAFLLSYEHCIERLFSGVSEGNGIPDLVAVPLLYLMRHAIELGYKFSLDGLCEINSNLFAPEARGGERHSLMKLHQRLGSEFEIAVKHGRVSGEDQEEFKKYYAITETSMHIFEGLDERSTKLRFPNSDPTLAFPRDKKVNLLQMKNAFDNAMILLGTIVDVIARPEGYY